MTLLAPAHAPVLADALAAIARRDPGAPAALAAAVAADEDVMLPTSDDGRHPLSVSDLDGRPALIAFTGPWSALWSQPWRPPCDLRPISEILGFVTSSARSLRLDHSSEGDTRIGPDEATALLAGRAVPTDALATGDPFRNPGPPSAAPEGPLPAAERRPSDDEGDVAYGRGWDPATRQLLEPVTEADLAAVPDLVGGYAAVRRRGEATEVIEFGEVEVTARRFVGGEVHVWVWERFAEGLFLSETSVAVDDGSRRPPPRWVVLTRPDGLIRSWVDNGDGTDETVTSTSSAMDDRWIGVPPLGVHHPLLDAGA